MPVSKPSNKRPASGVPGVKMLITATSLAATIGGWAVLSNQAAVSSAGSTPAADPAKPAPALSVQLPPLPTLIPPPDPKSLVINTQPVVVPSTKRQTVAPAQAAAAPAPQIAGLRVVNAPAAVSGGSAPARNGGGGSVSAPPPPAANTGSSKP